MEEALDLFAHVRGGWPADAHLEEAQTRMTELLRKAILSGCRDPFVAYILARAEWFSGAALTQDLVDRLKDAAEDMDSSGYPALLKTYAFFRAYDAARTLDGADQDKRARRANAQLAAKAYESLDAALHMPGLPGYEAAAVYDQVFEPELHPTLLAQLDLILNGRWPADPWIQGLRGRLFLKAAWRQRGSGFAGTVKDDQWKAFGESLETAGKALELAWAGIPDDARIPARMVELELAQGRGRDRLELWFQRAMAIDTNCWDACWWKLEYLEPKWYGSTRETIAFGRQCLTNRAWNPRLGMILVHAHRMAAGPGHGRAEDPDYWKGPGVWDDVRAACEQYLALNPGDQAERQKYALLAWKCGRMEDFTRILSGVKPIDPALFGGEDKLQEMRDAAAVAAKAK